ncbi:glutamate receptor U1 isoform X2 [Solenopsis invicta]|uniref:glutamate receptor U1 isoform X2 n=1 Tax=Solenopsis invicta TaxID=13686 RepID=UPI00193D4087|nr:glutamate receptor U1 isoform X2 [Solenopsis invicta]
MFFVVLCIVLAVSLDNASSCRIDKIILQFIVDATPILLSPSRISLHTCISYDDMTGLSREMSRYHLMHGIYNVENSEKRIYDNLEHRNLYMLDMNCDSSIEILRQITNPDTINHLTDFEYNTIDPITKANYIWLVHLVSRMNATLSFNIANNWGHNKNGSWDGMIGMLQRREIDIGGTGMFMLTERISVLEYIQLYTHSSLCFVFRQPSLSTMKNIFTLPFQQNVWVATAIFLVLVFCLLYISIKWEHYRGTSKKSAAYWNQLNNSKPTVTDNFFILLGAFAQQGYSYEPYRIPSRIVILMLLLASLSLYAAYTANIVTLFQSTTDKIKTLSDLLYSPLTLGGQDLPYNKYYFKSTGIQDPIRKAMVKKIEPEGRKANWMSLEEGVRRIRSETFAFHGIQSPIYHVIQRTYQEAEKCGLTEIDYLNTIYPAFTIQKHSRYLEIIKNGALKLREYGLKYRDEYRLYTRKPTCTSQIGFITIGFTQCSFAIIIMGYGVLLSVIVFVLELLWNKRQNMNILEEAVPTDGRRSDHQIH